MPPGPHETTFGAFKQVRLTEDECIRLQAISKDALSFLDRYIASTDPAVTDALRLNAIIRRKEIASIQEKTKW